MDFLDPAKKRAMRIRLIAGYFLIALAIALVSLILVFQSYGYDLDRKTGSIIQNGLMFVSAQPEPADIYLNGELVKSRDNARLVLPSDVYKLELKRDGYRSWQKTVSLAGGSIERLVYPFLFPTTLDTKDQYGYGAAPGFASQSPDRHWIIVQPAGQIDKLEVFDTTNFKKLPVTITLPSGLLPAATSHKIEPVEWSTDNRHLLIKDTTPNGRQFMVIDRQTPANSYNVNATFNRNPTTVSLHDNKYDQLYLYNQADKSLSLATQKTAAVKLVLNQVLSYTPYGNDIIIYATDSQAAAGKVRVIYHDKNGDFLLNQVPLGQTYLMDMAQYQGDWYVASGSSTDGRIYVYKNPQDVIEHTDSKKKLYPTIVMRLDNPNWLKFSANTQFLAVESGSHFAVFDAERQRSYSYTLPVSLDASPAGVPHASWMDGDRLLVNSGGKMVVTDYDGLNQQTLAANLPGFTPFFDRDYKLLFNIAPSASKPNGFALTRTNLIATKANQPKQ